MKTKHSILETQKILRDRRCNPDRRFHLVGKLGRNGNRSRRKIRNAQYGKPAVTPRLIQHPLRGFDRVLWFLSQESEMPGRLAASANILDHNGIAVTPKDVSDSL